MWQLVKTHFEMHDADAIHVAIPAKVVIAEWKLEVLMCGLPIEHLSNVVSCIAAIEEGHKEMPMEEDVKLHAVTKSEAPGPASSGKLLP
jgi:hypothetical protein